ncbi:hypothetical protein Dtox_0657 [Desulfofarcimen acetoxidans DSM 771]|uniref:Uncharacterized protein n=1 Tax=Desulfofarcimen acetoxidans (strain ATCC 49208 / DSM 771 / KCTC 5769 / VKM B-1644 / 5575) TaxID=485916 RepID=C8W1C8_DESAS|nr:hypothetical protein [Desulfofarcimen acetoxidans]ACV61573.1 hypothetical protein Dtox_0657 [Desulfofarcimen acetoxidans DSM 771]
METHLGYSTEEVFGLLKECLINRLAIQQTNRSWLSITQPSSQLVEILNALKCEVVIDKKRFEPVLKAAERWM